MDKSKNWIDISLEDVADLTVGFVGKTTNHYVNNGIRFLRSQNVEPFRINLADERFIDEPFHRSIKKSQLEAGDVVIVRTGNPGASAVIPEKNEEWNCSDLVIIKPDHTRINSTFLAAFLNLSYGVISSNLVGAVQQHFNVGAAKKLRLKLPSLKEQNIIASYIDSLNEKITINEKINQNLEEQAQVLINNMVGKYSISAIKDELSILPTNWHYHTLESITSQVKPGTNYQPKRISQGIPFLNVKCISNGYIDTSDAKLISEADYSKVHKTWQPEAHDLLISRIGTLGLVAVIREEDLPLAVHYNFIEIKPKTIPYEAMYFLLKSKGFQTAYHGLAKQSVQEYVTIDEVASLQIPLPDDITRFADLLVPLYKLIESNQRVTKRLAILRDSLLPRLMSGELDVSNLNI